MTAKPAESSTLAPVPGAGPAPAASASDLPPGMSAFVVDPPPSGRRVNAAWVLLAGAVAVSACVLGGMRWVGMQGGIGAADIKFDQSLVEAANRPRRDHAVVLEDLKSSRVDRQVPGEQVKKNPFRLADAVAGLVPLDGEADDATRAAALRAQQELSASARRDAERAQMVEDEFRNLKLQTVLGGTTPLARVSGKTVRVGDKLGKFFQVKAIHGRTIELVADNRVFELGIAPTDLADGPRTSD